MPTESGDRARRGRVGLLAHATVVALITAVLIAYAGSSLLGRTALSLPANGTVGEITNAVFPQGWAFFTKSPRTPEVIAVGFDGRRFHRIGAPEPSPVRWFVGANRGPRAVELEIRELGPVLNEQTWFDCDAQLSAACVRSAIEALGTVERVKPSATRPTVCSETLVIVRDGVLAWAYANGGFGDDTTSDEIKVVEAPCDR